MKIETAQTDQSLPASSMRDAISASSPTTSSGSLSSSSAPTDNMDQQQLQQQGHGRNQPAHPSSTCESQSGCRASEITVIIDEVLELLADDADEDLLWIDQDEYQQQATQQDQPFHFSSCGLH